MLDTAAMNFFVAGVGSHAALGSPGIVLAAHSSMLALLYLPVSLVFDYGSWIPAFIP